jgi:trans-aconitate methyltransferase
MTKANYEKEYINIEDGKKYAFYYEGENNDLSEKTIDDCIAYAVMAKSFLNKPMNSPRDIVGNYEWHEEYPYEEWLLKHVTHSPDLLGKDLRAIDFGCGVGRMMSRMKKHYQFVDGVDVSSYAMDYGKQVLPDSQFYESSGLDLGQVPDDTYDLFYSTIAMQHIPVRTIRKNLFRGMFNALKSGGWLSIQMAFNPDAKAGRWSHDTEHADYEADFIGANATNGHADVIINMNDLSKIGADIVDVFGNKVFLESDNVASKYGNLNGHYHAPYWASHWLYITVQK